MTDTRQHTQEYYELCTKYNRGFFCPFYEKYLCGIVYESFCKEGNMTKNCLYKEHCWAYGNKVNEVRKDNNSTPHTYNPNTPHHHHPKTKGAQERELRSISPASKCRISEMRQPVGRGYGSPGSLREASAWHTATRAELRTGPLQILQSFSPQTPAGQARPARLLLEIRGLGMCSSSLMLKKIIISHPDVFERSQFVSSVDTLLVLSFQN